MTLMVIGILLWIGAHLFKRVMPEARASLGNKGQGLVALTLLASVVLMVVGYRAAPFVNVWVPPSYLTHVNNLLVLVGIWAMSPAGTKGMLLSRVRHPMLMGFRLWALAHLLVNGDQASIVLFGGLLAWGVIEVVVINRAEPDWTRRKDGSLAKDGMFFAASIVLLTVIGYVHSLVGPSPFPG
ncbi:NnrU family protein [Parasedimentitalea maritima]|uniref:NnrU domain-containing protein n=1 Tax=Parasedimentitalea maritima TaxID=2578117 RepID=A0A6A4RLG8_9RHOB|nr:NnrU family protein [Zongyanglinia marina]KAE9632689.1 hypothetical protein GP644_02645 [Zongyanglinia marina]